MGHEDRRAASLVSASNPGLGSRRLQGCAEIRERVVSKTGPAVVLAVDLAGFARSIGISKRLASEWRRRKLLPEPDICRGRVIRWRLSTIEAWLATGGKPDDGSSCGGNRGD
jgi:hypothetical protein